MKAMRKPPAHQRYSNTFFIFPVLLPLAELLPLLLTLIGMLAGGLHFLKKSLWANRYTRMITAGTAIISLGIAVHMVAGRVANTPGTLEGSWLVEVGKHSRLQQVSPPPAAGITSTSNSFSLLWSSATPRQNIGKPAFLDNMLLVGTYQGTLDAFSAKDGQHVWTLHKLEQIFPAVSASGRMAFIGEGHHTSPSSVLTAFGLPEGNPLWERNFRSHIESSVLPDATNHRIFMTAGETGVWALNSRDGSVKWRNPAGHTDVTPALIGNTLYVTAQIREDAAGSALFMIDANTGETQQSLSLPGNPMGSVLPDGKDALYVATAIGQVGVKKTSNTGWAHRVSASGMLIWTTPLPAMPLPEGLLVEEAGIVVYTLDDGTILGLRLSDGSIAWKEKLGNSFQTDAALIHEKGHAPLIASITEEGLLTLRDASTGVETRRVNVEAGIGYCLYHEGILYVSTAYSLRAYSGAGG